MNKITLVLIFVLMISFPAYATLWAERQDDYQPQSDSRCAIFESIQNGFNWEQYQDVAENGTVSEMNNLISDYKDMVGEYTVFENEIGVLYYNMMILSLKIVYTNRFESSNLESEEYKKILQELDEKTEKINNFISQCN